LGRVHRVTPPPDYVLEPTHLRSPLVPPRQRTFRLARLAVPVVLGLCVLVATATPASAHNAIESSNPADGDQLEEAPTSLSMVFQKAVPLDTVSAQFRGADGVRRDLTGFEHGALGDREVVVELPRVAPGPMQVRWRLVGPDGHPITGRIALTMGAASAAKGAQTGDAGDPGEPRWGSDDEVQAGATTPEWVRWAARFCAYAALMVLVGIVATAGFIWPQSWDQPVVRRLVAGAVAMSVGAAIVQWLVVAADIDGSGIGADSVGELSAALSTDAGKAYAARAVLLAIFTWVVFRLHAKPRLRWGAAGVVSLLALATWAQAGHARSMRMPFVGVPLDVIHSAAAATWLGGLVLIGVVARAVCRPEELQALYQRFSPLAAWSVCVIVATGLAQTVRLAGNPLALFGNAHGRLLLAKLLMLGLMLKVADINRRRIMNRFRAEAPAPRGLVLAVGRAMTTEFAVGLGILALTAVLVVSPPATAEEPVDATPAAESSAPGLPVRTNTTMTAGCEGDASILRLGDPGPQVDCLQRALRRVEPIPAAIGDFDEASAAAASTLHAAEGLDQDAIVEPAAAAALRGP
jgi:copper transport protein